MCDLTPSGSDAITHLAFYFVNEEKPQIRKKSRIAFAGWAIGDVLSGSLFVLLTAL